MRSGFEYQVRDDLTKRGIDFDYEEDIIPYRSLVRGSKCTECGAKVYKERKYTPDFKIHRSDCTVLYVEAKGRFTSPNRSLMRDVVKCNPHLDIRLLFQKRGAKDRNAIIKWCEKFGFDYHFGHEVPDSWLS